MSERRVVVLNYGNDGVKPVPEPVPLNPDDTVAFELGPGVPNGKIRVTFADAQYFSRADYEQGDPRGDIKVTAKLKGPVPYKCELFVDGIPRQLPPTAGGGTGQPGGGGGSVGR